jgi:transposase
MKTQLEVPLNESKDYVSEAVRKTVFKSCKSTIATLIKDIERVEESIELLIKSDVKLQHQVNLAKSVPGIGKITALNMIISSGEFEQITEPKKFACYAGVAPFEHTSGSSVRGKSKVSSLANMTIKKLLHMAALSGIQHNEELKFFYNRKLEQGKNKMSVINAVRNKLISRVFACVKNNRVYQKDFLNALA